MNFTNETLLGNQSAVSFTTTPWLVSVTNVTDSHEDKVATTEDYDVDGNYGGNETFSNSSLDEYYYDFYDYKYEDSGYYDDVHSDGVDLYDLVAYSFERSIYLYVWIVFIIITALANVLVIVVLRRKHMRNATNIILIAIAVSDSLTGLVTLPTYIHAYSQYFGAAGGNHGVIQLTRGWCEAFMLIKYFVSRAFHTMSIWLTVLLCLQRFVSVYLPFKASSLFTIRKTSILIIVVSIFSPVLHVYHVTGSKAISSTYTIHGNVTGQVRDCLWKLGDECDGGCVYLWMTFTLMHFLPCVCLVVFSVLMVCTMNKATNKMKKSQMIANVQKMNKRDRESRRITIVVCAVVIVFLIPEIPYGVFLLINVILHHSKQNLLPLETNRLLICTYEVLVVLSFHANFWIYLVMNTRFRRGLVRTFDPIMPPMYAVMNKFGVKREFRRQESETSGNSYGRTPNTEMMTAASRRSSMSHQLVSRNNSSNLEMKTYTFKPNTSALADEGQGRNNDAYS